MASKKEQPDSSNQGPWGRPNQAEHSALTAYEAMAAYYDDFTAHHDHELAIGNLLPAIERRGLPSSRRLLDVGCGTGKSFLPMLERGWSVTACDLSPAMIQVAREKLGGRSVELAVADMRHLPTFGQFDLVWSLDDGLNYLLNLEDLQLALKGMVANLHPEGTLVFDLNTLLSFRTFFAEEAVIEWSGRRMIWSGRADPAGPPGMLAEAMLSVESVSTSADEDMVPHSLHRERHFPEADVLQALEKAGRRSIDVFGIHDDAVLQQPLDELRHTKAIYIA